MLKKKLIIIITILKGVIILLDWFDVFFVLLAVYLIYINKFSWGVFERAFIILIILSFYRYIGEYFGLPLHRGLNILSEKIFKKTIEKTKEYRKAIVGRAEIAPNLIKNFVLLRMWFVIVR